MKELSLRFQADPFFKEKIAEIPAFRETGRVLSVHGSLIRVGLRSVHVGQFVEIAVGQKTLKAQVIGFDTEGVSVSPLGEALLVSPGALVRPLVKSMSFAAGDFLLGSLLNAQGEVLYRRPQMISSRLANALLERKPTPISPLERENIDQRLHCGIRAIDTFTPVGYGQRLAVFAEPGVGKSSLLCSLARNAAVDVRVIALIGERGREVKEAINTFLVPESGRFTIVVASTSEEPAVARVLAAETALCIADYFRQSGKDVLFLLDSLTRLLRAYREIGLAAGEVPVRRGYPASVFSKLPQLIERAGRMKVGSITAFYTVLLSGELEEDPMVEEIKGLTDGHLMLRREVSERGCYPALDVLASLSRLEQNIQNKTIREKASDLRKKLAYLKSSLELLKLTGGQDEQVRELEAFESSLYAFLCQATEEHCSEERLVELLDLLSHDAQH